MALSLLEDLNSINPEAALADFTNQLSHPETILGKVS